MPFYIFLYIYADRNGDCSFITMSNTINVQQTLIKKTKPVKKREKKVNFNL